MQPASSCTSLVSVRSSYPRSVTPGHGVTRSDITPSECLRIEVVRRSVLDALVAEPAPRGNDLAGQGASQLARALFGQLECAQLREPVVTA